MNVNNDYESKIEALVTDCLMNKLGGKRTYMKIPDGVNVDK